MSHEALPGARQVIDRALQEEGVRAVGFECPQPAFERRDTVVDRIDRQHDIVERERDDGLRIGIGQRRRDEGEEMGLHGQMVQEGGRDRAADLGGAVDEFC